MSSLKAIKVRTDFFVIYFNSQYHDLIKLVSAMLCKLLHCCSCFIFFALSL